MPALNRATFRTLAAAFVALAGVVGMWGAETVFARSAGDWPADAFELAQLAGLSLLLGLGLLTSIVILARLVGYRRRVERAREAELERLAHAALTDSLTGLGNHRAFHENLERELQRRARSGSTFSIVMLDLDGLKQVNDSLGHQAGDEQIRALADCMRATMRVVDSGYRIGGDELMVLLPDERGLGRVHVCAALSARGVAASQPASASAAGSPRRRIPRTPTGSSARPISRCMRRSDRAGGSSSTRTRSRRSRPSRPRSARRDTSSGCSRPRSPARSTPRTPVRAITARPSPSSARGSRSRSASTTRGSSASGWRGCCTTSARSASRTGFSESPSRLTADEAATMSSHVRIGHAIVAAAELEDEARWVLHHHEHLDGSGYPLGLRGDEIPLESRIILVADAFEAMTADRPYRKGCSARGRAGRARASRRRTVRPCLRRGAALCHSISQINTQAVRGLMPTTKVTMTNAPLSIDPLLAAMAERNASDLHLTAGSPPVIRVNGKLERLPETDDLELDDIRTLVYRILSTEQQKLLETKRQLDFSYSLPGVARFRVNAYFQRDEPRGRVPHDPDADQDARGARACPSASTSSARSRAASCSSPARPAPASRRRSRR